MVEEKKLTPQFMSWKKLKSGGLFARQLSKFNQSTWPEMTWISKKDNKKELLFENCSFRI